MQFTVDRSAKTRAKHKASKVKLAFVQHFGFGQNNTVRVKVRVNDGYACTCRWTIVRKMKVMQATSSKGKQKARKAPAGEIGSETFVLPPPRAGGVGTLTGWERQLTANAGSVTVFVTLGVVPAAFCVCCHLV